MPLPNKLFDYIHAEIPVIASDLIEVKKIINTYNVGLIVEKVSPNDIAKQVKLLQTNPNLYEELCSNCKKAKINSTPAAKNLYSIGIIAYFLSKNIRNNQQKEDNLSHIKGIF